MSSKQRLSPNMATERAQAERAAASWIARRDVGPWTEAETTALAAWLEESAGNRVAYYRLNSAWQEAGRLKALIGARSTVSSQTPRSGHWSRHPLTLAASLLVVVAAMLFAFRGDLFQRERYSTVVGGLQAIPMPDGSKVILNTASELRIAITDSERRVELEQGEAFFEVARDRARPFVVVAGNRRVVAVGTAFSVRRDGNDVRVAVTAGVVRLAQRDSDPGSSLLTPGTVARVRNGNVLVQRKPLAEIEQTLSWRSGVLTFRDTPLAQAVAEFNRYNTRKMAIEDPAVAAIEIGGIFRATNLESFVQLLQDGFPVRAVAQEDRIVLQAN
jgi:transmembrane sensor